jgi:hypothetical protein
MIPGSAVVNHGWYGPDPHCRWTRCREAPTLATSPSEHPLERREVLRALGATAALGFLPRNAHAVWELAKVRPSTTAAALSPAQAALVNAVGDTILPRTDTPSASDVGVVDWVDVLVAEYYSDEDKATFLAGLDAIDAAAKTATGSVLADLSPDARGAVIAAIEGSTDRRTEPARTYWRLKGLVIHGYFTSERVQKEVLKTEIMPGRFVGDAPHLVRIGVPQR